MENINEKYAAPKDDKEFVKYWDRYLPKVIKRENFHESHLDQLEILCDLYLDYHELTKFIKKNGYSYEGDGRYGKSSNEYKEVSIRQKIIGEIRHFSKLLDLVLNKDQDKKEKPKVKNKWEKK